MKKILLLNLIALFMFGIFSLPGAEKLIGIHTFSGGFGEDDICAIDRDKSDHLYVVGKSRNSWGNPVNAHSGEDDVFVARYKADGTLIWNTFLGGLEDDWGCDIKLASNGDVFITGSSEATWKKYTPVESFHGGDSDGFVAKLDKDGKLQWYVFVGGYEADTASNLAVDIDSNVYLIGNSESQWGSPITPFEEGLFGYDAFVCKLSPSGAVIWNTFNGEWGNPAFTGIVVTPNGSVVVGGTITRYSTPCPLLLEYSNSGYKTNDLVNLNGLYYQWGLMINSLASDKTGDVYFAGTDQAWEKSWGTPIVQRKFAKEGFVAKVAMNTRKIAWNTFIGEADTGCRAISLDENNAIFVLGDADRLWGQPSESFDGSENTGIYVMKLKKDGHYEWHNFLGGSGHDYGSKICTTSDGSAFIAGKSDLSWGNPLNSHRNDGHYDFFLTQLKLVIPDDPPQIKIVSPIEGVSVKGTISLNASVSDDIGLKGDLEMYIDGVLIQSFDVNGQKNKSCNAEFNTHALYNNHSHTLKVVAVDTKNQSTTKECIFKALNHTITLSASRVSERSWFSTRQYGSLLFKITNPGNISISKYLIQRADAAGEFQTIKELTSDPALTEYTQNDAYLDPDKSYRYRVVAYYAITNQEITASGEIGI